MLKAYPWNKSVPRAEADQGTGNAEFRLAADRIITAVAAGFRRFERIIPDQRRCGNA